MLDPVRLLKIRLMTEGLSVSREAARRLAGPSGDRPLTLADYASTSGVSLEMEGGVWVNAPIRDHNPNFVNAPPHALECIDGRFVVRSGSLEVAVNPVPVPRYSKERNRWGEPYTSLAITHTDRVRISPIEGCAMVCRFCDLPYEFRYRRKSVEQLVDSVGRALRDEDLPAQHVLISGGTPKPEDYEYENEVYAAVCGAFPGVHVDVMMVPSPGLLDARRLRRTGVHGLSINLELWDEEVAWREMRPKARIGRGAYLRFIEQAVAEFGAGQVRSLLLVGLEPVESTLAGVDVLARMGCDPVLSPFRPDPSTPLRDQPPPGVELLVEAYQRSMDIVSRHGAVLGPRCIPCHHNTLTFPVGDRYYSSCAGARSDEAHAAPASRG